MQKIDSTWIGMFVRVRKEPSTTIRWFATFFSILS